MYSGIILLALFIVIGIILFYVRLATIQKISILCYYIMDCLLDEVMYYRNGDENIFKEFICLNKDLADKIKEDKDFYSNRNDFSGIDNDFLWMKKFHFFKFSLYPSKASSFLKEDITELIDQEIFNYIIDKAFDKYLRFKYKDFHRSHFVNFLSELKNDITNDKFDQLFKY